MTRRTVGGYSGLARWEARVRRVTLALPLALLGSAAASAQSSEVTSSPPERIVLSLEQRTRVEGFTNPFRLDELGPTRVVAARTRLLAVLPKIVGPLGALVELQDSRSGWNEKPFLVPARHVNPLDVLQAQLRLGSGGVRGRAAGWSVELGRFTLDLGRRRLAARNGMRNTTNSFDGVRGQISGEGGSTLQAFVSRPVQIEPESLDRSEGRRLFWGGTVTLARWPLVTSDLYVLRLDESVETLTRSRLTTLGARLYRDPVPGALDYEIEAAWQGGTVEDEHHDAVFVHLEAGFSLRGARARVATLYDHASGDSDPADARSQRFDTLFGARAFEYAPTGIYGPFFRANIEGPGARLTASPAPSVDVVVAYRALWLAEARDGWFGSGLRDPSGRSGRFLGHHLEANVRWRPRRWLLVEAVWAHFFKGSYLDRVPGSPRTPGSDYVTVGFMVGDTLLAR